ncbi:holo-ACP synthase [Buchananella hordeovulneris]|uniref:Holo-[acyl-carrier-protein] synthase n=1 Tax=Buchananella hordeovulneris TaxID=52770 RepID=A0A1Q5PYQ8_9ACTO|nr:holo-ACP synthase [Buchananella hordeovulneris]MDO5080211.1 holo-ACP synthase [Buchananella hordeovulneris]OKL52761.1 holo-ACP synthase [Buchananella hordeovulneris]RRD43857.1 holo-ACP synthase [Buchananella hordeovulneris]RRD51985.1 holo-ACP synthase [Buchananella hordeovulneris]
MIVGIGVDIVNVPRFAAALARSARLGPRLLTAAELARPARSQAARFAAKEALAKALGSPGNLRWHDCEVRGGGQQPPRFAVSGTVAAALAARGGRHIHLTLSHDGDHAVALVVVEA